MSTHDLRNGYDANFLGEGTSLPMPEIGLEHYHDVVTGDDLREGHIVDYIHYSIVMSGSNRQAFFSAANLDQDAYRKVKGRRWFIDERIGSAAQIGPAAYVSNPWDPGTPHTPDGGDLGLLLRSQSREQRFLLLRKRKLATRQIQSG